MIQKSQFVKMQDCSRFLQIRWHILIFSCLSCHHEGRLFKYMGSEKNNTILVLCNVLESHFLWIWWSSLRLFVHMFWWLSIFCVWSTGPVQISKIMSIVWCFQIMHLLSSSVKVLQPIEPIFAVKITLRELFTQCRSYQFTYSVYLYELSRNWLIRGSILYFM